MSNGYALVKSVFFVLPQLFVNGFLKEEKGEVFDEFSEVLTE